MLMGDAVPNVSTSKSNISRKFDCRENISVPIQNVSSIELSTRLKDPSFMHKCVVKGCNTIRKQLDDKITLFS